MQLSYTMTMQEYRDLPGISSHALADFKKSPALYYRKHIAKAIPDYTTDAMIFGTATHALTLQGKDGFDREVIVAPDAFVTDGGSLSRSKDAKAWAEEAKASGRVIITPQDHALVQVLAKKVRDNRIAAEYLKDGKAEVVCQDPHVSGLPLKGRADWVGADFILDLKTCGDLDEFATDAVKYGYPAQMAFYCSLFNKSQAVLVAVEKREPNRVGVFKVAPDLLFQCQKENSEALADLWNCMDEDEWPGDPSGIQLLTLSAKGNA